jgi:hypothetical protein
MKILVIAKQKDSAILVPPAVFRQLLEISMAGIAQMKKAGKLLDFYFSPLGYSIVILNYNTAEEWQKDMGLMPLLSYMDFESYPLADGNEAMKSLLEQLKAAEKMMAGAPR